MTIAVAPYTFHKVLHPVSFGETAIENTYQNESGGTIIYPVRSRQRKMQLSIELDSAALEAFLTAFSAPEIRLDGVGVFRKTSEISVKTVSETVQLASAAYSINGILQPPDTGIYTATVSLEEV